ncbi:S9 family peptidase [Tenggerimyces flavus]|uniref:S9 family peptidase n=1 Tax=Tenggerimyces flavus TaxID=1708749 RepID=A0ABV7YG50_9ACTN|nr:S9 family peptidase [Tenggerimyces flavus]MBM7788085.1 dipeptidyl aminopeptidase/acylaminoacyl peptidase [Tenggerimyces flavus]
MSTELTAELLTSLWIPQSIDLSPDATRVAWSAGPFGKEDEHHEAAIFVADVGVAGSGRRWTYGGADRIPCWSPDGTRLAFLSDRKERGTNGLYVMSADGGEARPIVVRKKSMETYAWSPDGTRIAFLAPSEPDEEDERREKERDDPAVYGERLPFRRLWLVDVESGEVTEVATGEVHVDGIAWSASGTKLAYIARTNPELDHTGTNALYVIALDGGEPERLCPAAWASTISWNDDAEPIVFTTYHKASVLGGLTVHAVDPKGGEPRIIGSSTDDPFCTVLATAIPGERRALVLVAEGLDTRLEWRDPTTGDAEPITELDSFPNGTAARVTDDGIVLAIASGHEVRTGRPGALELVSDHHEPVADVAVGALENFTWRSADGLELDGILIRPTNAGDGPYPLIVVPHGGPYGRVDRSEILGWWTWGQWLSTIGYAALMPNYRGGMGHGHAFAELARNGVGGDEFGDVMAAVDAAIERGIADPDRLAIGGWSQGGFLTAWAVTQTDRFKAGIMGAGVSDWGGMVLQGDIGGIEAEFCGDRPWDGPGPHEAAKKSPISYAKNVTTPLLILHGEKDARVPLPQATGFQRALKDHDATVRFVTYPREGHGIVEAKHQRHLLAEVRAWIEKYV